MYKMDRLPFGASCSPLEPAVYKMDRLPFGASCSPFVAIHTVRQIMEDAGDEKMAAVVRERMNVDNYFN